MKKLVFFNLILCLWLGPLFGQCPSPVGSSMANPYIVGTLSDGIPFTHTWNNTPGNCNGSGIYYKFTLNSTLIVDISHAGSTIVASQFYILDSYGYEIEYSNWYDPEYDWEPPSMQYVLPAGTYYILSEGSSYGFLGDITTRISADEQRGKNFTKPIEVGVLVPGGVFWDTQSTDPFYEFGNNVGGAGDDIFYRFTVSYDTEVTISTCNSDVSSDLMLFNSVGTLITSNGGNGPICNNERGSLRVNLTAGTYYAVVENSIIWDYGNVGMRISIEGRDGMTASGAISAGILDVGTPYSGTVDNSPEQGYGNSTGQPSHDIYHKFIMSRKGVVNISHCGSMIDTYMHLLDANGAIIAANNDNGPLCTGETASIKRVLDPGIYYVVSEGNGNASGEINLQISMSLDVGLGFSFDQNHIITRIPSMEIRDVVILDNLTSDKEKVRTTVQYFDGLGRALQTVQLRGSPLGKDMIQPIAYDSLGREANKFLPYVASDGTVGNYRPQALVANSSYNMSQQYSFYQENTTQGIVATSHPYSKTIFEPSPLNRIVEQGAPGDVWQPAGTLGAVNAGHTVKMVYGTNTDETGDYPVKLYGAISDPLYEHGRTLINSGSYTPAELYLTIAKDENWVSGKGGTVEEYKDKENKVILKRVWSDETTALSTYYVYDDLGNLSFVLPPGANPDMAIPDQAALDNYCYLYRYDSRKRLIEKKLPGKGWEHLVYNKLDQLVASQDSLQRMNNQWLFSKYDGLGRPVLSGLAVISGARTQVQTALDAHAVLWETRDNTNVVTGYRDSTQTYPKTGIVHYLTMNYYDDYNFPGSSVVSAQSTVSLLTKGLPTGIRVFTADGTASYLSASYYDDKGRLIQSVSQNHLGGTDRMVNTYNFSNELLSSKRTHEAGSQTTVIGNTYTYDHMGRKLRSGQYINDPGSKVILNESVYNEIGQLKEKKVHSSDSGSTFLNTTAYSYNPRGWLKGQSSPHFSMTLKYEDGTNPQYNGNISSQYWGKANPSLHNYSYLYDKLNRLTSGVSNEEFNETLSYDNMGNILSMNRNPMGTNSYSYSGNRLTAISGFVNSSYGYDGNGNQVSDSGKDITLNYNYLNLPQTIAKASTLEAMENTWLANGTKLRKVVGSLTRDYVGGIEYNNGQIEFIQTEEGRAIPTGSNTYSYEYMLKDHLGNTRILLKQDGSVLDSTDYYPFGLQIARSGQVVPSPENRYKYNGKELQTELGLGQYDYGARFYDPVVGRWNVVDPLAEKYMPFSPYVYAADNPLLFVDIDGRDIRPWMVVSSGRESSQIGKYIYNKATKPFFYAMHDFSRTSYGKSVLSLFMKKGQNAYGYKANKDGKYSNINLHIVDINISDPMEKGAFFKDTGGFNVFEEEGGKLGFQIYINDNGASKRELGETITHELGVHGSKIEEIVEAYKAGGMGAVNDLMKSTETTDHKSLKNKNRKHSGVDNYLKTKDELIGLDKSYEKSFEKAKEDHERKYKHL